MQTLLELPMVIHADKAFQSVLRANKWITPEQARNCIIVEITNEAYREIMSVLPTSPDFYTRREGAMTINGIRYYRVDRLKDGDTWRVLNALGVN